jgi:uncharacterized membrane protein
LKTSFSEGAFLLPAPTRLPDETRPFGTENHIIHHSVFRRGAFQINQKSLGGPLMSENKLHARETSRGKSAQPKKARKNIPYGKLLYSAFIILVIAAMLATPVFATTVWTKANQIMRDVYGQILGISTVAGIVTASIALLLMNFSKNGKTVDESRSWLKRIVITWAILNSLGFIMAYITPFFAGGRWN